MNIYLVVIFELLTRILKFIVNLLSTGGRNREEVNASNWRHAFKYLEFRIKQD